MPLTVGRERAGSCWLLWGTNVNRIGITAIVGAALLVSLDFRRHAWSGLVFLEAEPILKLANFVHVFFVNSLKGQYKRAIILASFWNYTLLRA